MIEPFKLVHLTNMERMITIEVNPNLSDDEAKAIAEERAATFLIQKEKEEYIPHHWDASIWNPIPEKQFGYFSLMRVLENVRDNGGLTYFGRYRIQAY